jgi:hypothetical protein
MEIDNLSLLSIILFNTIICLFVPKIVTFDWGKLLTKKVELDSYSAKGSSQLVQEEIV